MHLPLLLLGAAVFAASAAIRVTDPVLPQIAAEFGATVGGAALIVTTFTLGYGFAQLAYGPLADRIGKLRVMTGALFVSALLATACAWAPSLTILAGLRLIAGAAGAAAIPLSMAYVADATPYATRQATMGRLMTAVMLGNLLSAVLGGMIGEWFGWRTIFAALAGLQCVIAIGLLRAMRSETLAHGNPSSWRTYAAIFARPYARLVLAGALVEGTMLVGTYPFIGALLKHRFDLPYTRIGLILAGAAAGGLLYTLAVRFLVRNLGERRLMIGGGFLTATGFVSIVLVPHPVLAVPVTVAIGFGFFMLHNTMQALASEIAPANRATGLTLFVFCIFLGQGIGALILGTLIDRWGYGAAFGTAAATVSALGLWLARYVAGRRTAA
jgi:predicted MFS family arabinose efflux permease